MEIIESHLTNMGTPILSVVMTVYNGEVFLAEAIESILTQTFTDFEFIIIDDGSTDRTPEILSQFANRDQRVRVIRQENRGRAESLNRAIELARARLIARMDADDISLPHRFSAQMDFMERHPDVGLLGGAYELIDTEGQRLRTICPPAEDAEIRALLRHYNPICHSAVILRREAVIGAGGYRKALLDVDDYDLWLRMSDRHKLANIKEVVLRYRIHGGQVSIRNMEHQTLCILVARTAASMRMQGKADPLSKLDEITPQLLDDLGIGRNEFRQALVDIYGGWIRLLRTAYPDAALGMLERLLQFAESEGLERRMRAEAWLGAAGIHYEKGRFIKAATSAGRAVLVRPIVAGRPLKKAFKRLVATFTM